MFTGLVEEVGRVSSLEGGEMLRLAILAGMVSEDACAGDSVSVNGACLTAGEVDGRTLTFLAMPETLRPPPAAASKWGVPSTWSGRCPRGAGSEDTSCRGMSMAS